MLTLALLLTLSIDVGCLEMGDPDRCVRTTAGYWICCTMTRSDFHRAPLCTIVDGPDPSADIIDVDPEARALISPDAGQCGAAFCFGSAIATCGGVAAIGVVQMNHPENEMVGACAFSCKGAPGSLMIPVDCRDPKSGERPIGACNVCPDDPCPAECTANSGASNGCTYLDADDKRCRGAEDQVAL